MEHYLFDGNNLIGHLAVLKRVFLKDKQKAREDALIIVEKFLNGKKCKATLFFDGFETIKLRHTWIKILYSGNATADSLIKKQIEHSHSRTNLVVVSSDLEIRSLAKANSCKVITSNEFEKLVLSNPSKPSKIQQNTSEKEHISEVNHDKNYFIKLFSSANGKSKDYSDN